MTGFGMALRPMQWVARSDFRRFAARKSNSRGFIFLFRSSVSSKNMSVSNWIWTAVCWSWLLAARYTFSSNGFRRSTRDIRSIVANILPPWLDFKQQNSSILIYFNHATLCLKSVELAWKKSYYDDTSYPALFYPHLLYCMWKQHTNDFLLARPLLIFRSIDR